MSIETLPQTPREDTWEELHELDTWHNHGDYSDPNDPALDKLLDEAGGDVLVASRLLLDRMISGEIW